MSLRAMWQPNNEQWPIHCSSSSEWHNMTMGWQQHRLTSQYDVIGQWQHSNTGGMTMTALWYPGHDDMVTMQDNNNVTTTQDDNHVTMMQDDYDVSMTNDDMWWNWDTNTSLTLTALSPCHSPIHPSWGCHQPSPSCGSCSPQLAHTTDPMSPWCPICKWAQMCWVYSHVDAGSDSAVPRIRWRYSTCQQVRVMDARGGADQGKRGSKGDTELCIIFFPEVIGSWITSFCWMYIRRFLNRYFLLFLFHYMSSVE